MQGTYREIIRRRKIGELITIKGNSPVCPACLNNNAMLGRITGELGKYKCRDCGFTLYPEKFVKVRTFENITPGMGVNTIYKEI